MNWTDFQKGVQDRIVVGSGLAGTSVIWENQSRQRPARPFISLSIIETETRDMGDVEVSDNPDYDPDLTPSEEILLTNTAMLVIQIRVTAFSSATVGNSSAYALLQKVRMHFGQVSCTDALTGLDEPIGFLQSSSVQNASLVLENEIEGRAVMTLTFTVGDSAVETNTYIESVVQTGTVLPPN